MLGRAGRNLRSTGSATTLGPGVVRMLMATGTRDNDMPAVLEIVLRQGLLSQGKGHQGKGNRYGKYVHVCVLP